MTLHGTRMENGWIDLCCHKVSFYIQCIQMHLFLLFFSPYFRTHHLLTLWYFRQSFKGKEDPTLEEILSTFAHFIGLEKLIYSTFRGQGHMPNTNFRRIFLSLYIFQSMACPNTHACGLCTWALCICLLTWRISGIFSKCLVGAWLALLNFWLLNVTHL